MGFFDSVTVELVLVAFFSSVFAWAIVSVIRKYGRLNKKAKKLEEKVFGRKKPLSSVLVADNLDSYILDHPTRGEICDMMASALMDPRPPFVLDPVLAHAELFAEFQQRNMVRFTISQEQFLREWREGTLNFEEVKGQRGFARGCTVSDFTEIVQMMFVTARREAPYACYSFTDQGNMYEVGIGRGKVVCVCRVEKLDR